MPMRDELRALLRGSSAVIAAAPGGLDWMERRQAAAGAFATLQVISGSTDQVQSGATRRTVSRVQIDCFAGAGMRAASDLADAVVRRLAGYRGGGFGGIFHVATRDGRDETDGGGAVYRVSLDFMVHHTSGD